MTGSHSSDESCPEKAPPPRVRRLSEVTLPKTIGPYRITGALGEGGMGTVYRAQQRQPQRMVALKVIRGGRYVDEQHIRLFQREAQALARLKHPNIAVIHDSGRTDDGRHYFAMELVEGVPLNAYIARRDPARKARLKLFCSICDAVKYAHQRAVIHRDLKPGNIMVDPGGHPKVLDFGLAKITEEDIAVTTIVTEVGRVQGTLAYMSPEQARASPDEVDLRSDVYSLGVILFELLTDRLPYDVERTALHDAVRLICDEEPLRPCSLDRSLGGDLETILLTSIAKDPSRRYQSAGAFAEDIRRYLTNQPILARPTSVSYQFRKLVARHKVPFAFIAALFLMVSGFGIWMNILYSRASDEAQKATWAKGFMVGLFKSSDPSEIRQSDVLARDLLDEGFKKVMQGSHKDPVIQAELIDTMGLAYRHLGLYDDTITLATEAVRIRRETFGEANPEYARSLFDLGWAWKSQGDYTKAKPYIQKALDLHRRLLGADHWRVGRNLHLLGTTHRDLGDYAAAKNALEEALVIRRKVFGDRGEMVANNLSDLADVLRELGDYDEAERCVLEALSIQKELALEGNQSHASVLVSLAAIRRSKGDYAVAESRLNEALVLRRKIYEHDDHPRVAVTLSWLGALSRDRGDLAKAEECLRNTVELMRKWMGDRHWSRAIAMSRLAWVRLDQGAFDEAEQFFRNATEILLERFGEKHPRMGGVQLGLARVALAKARPEAAERLAREVLNIYESVLPPDHWLVARAEGVLGECLGAQGKLGDAELLLRRSHAAMTRIRGSADRYVLEAKERIFTLPKASGPPRVGGTDR